MKKRLALIVDDEESFLEIVSTRLKAVGFSVEMANVFSDALEKAERLVPDVILSDVHMPPGPSGWELGLQLRSNQITARIPFALFTSLYDPWSEFPGGRTRAETLLKPVAILSKTDDVENLGEKVLAFLS